MIGMPPVTDPAVLLFVQHGWADTSRSFRTLARGLSTPKTKVINPNLGYLRTWIRMDRLVDHVEAEATAIVEANPNAIIRIVGHSMGGLIWLEVLDRRPEWWPRVDGIVLIGSPVGGSDLAGLLDPLGVAIGRDLRIDRRPIAARIAQQIRMLSIAGDVDAGSDLVIPLQSTKAPGARFVCVPATTHMALRTSPLVLRFARAFFRRVEPAPTNYDDLARRLRATPGMTDAHPRDYFRTAAAIVFGDGASVRAGKNMIGLDHVYVVSPDNLPQFSGFVSWAHANALRKTLAGIRHDYAADILWSSRKIEL
jgi:pimeloyl-ACP methyl ester carboxylesterase